MIEALQAAVPAPHTLLTLGRRVVLFATALLAVFLLWRYGWPQQGPTRRKETVFQRMVVVALTAVVAVEAVSVGLTGRSAVVNWPAALAYVRDAAGAIA